MSKKKENLKGLKKDELEKKLSTLREEIRTIHFRVQGAKSKNVKETLALRKDVARILTQINQDK
jgi:ribosomal protein L29